MLNERCIELIKSTAPVLAERGKEITGRFYELLFEQNPELKNIFNMSNQQGGAQQEALARAVYAFAANVDNLSALLGEVERIAQKHASLGIAAEHYPLVGKALLEAIDELLAPPTEVLDAWAAGYGVLADVFIAREAEIYQQKATQSGGWDRVRPFTIVKKERESELVSSFYLAPQDGGEVADYLPGQYIAVYVKLQEQQQIRQYSLSGNQQDNLYRISVKRDETKDASTSVSNYLHDQLGVGDILNISNPFGEFYLQQSEKPAVLISGGVGITPMQSMLETLVSAESEREIHFVHGTLDRSQHSFAERLQELNVEGRVTPHIFYEQAREEDVFGQDYHYQGRTDLTALQEQLPVGEAEFYLCGPLPMMQSVYAQLKDLQVPDEQIHYEVFGPTKSLAAS